MRFLILFFATILFADIKPILNKIKEIESYKYQIKPFVNYNIFSFYSDKTKKKSTFNVVKKFFKIKFVLEAIMNKKAIINGKMLSIGDTIHGYKLINIYKDYVILKKENKILTLTFKPKIIGVSR